MRDMMAHLSNALIALTPARCWRSSIRARSSITPGSARSALMSGPYVVTAAANYPERLSCIASIYGARMVTDEADSPHRVVDKLKCESYFACAEIDQYAPKEMIDTLEAALKQARARYRLEWYPGAQHGFAFPQRQGIYDKPSAERHWVRLFSLFRRTLGA
jgi:carboxymethylenebutenolidase